MITKEIGNRFVEGTNLHNIGNTYGKVGQYAKSLEYYQQALAISKETGDRFREVTTLNNIGFTYYNFLGQYVKALEYHQQSLTISKEIGSRSGEVYTLNHIASINLKIGQYSKAIEYN